MADGTYIEVEGVFRFAITQSGLDYDVLKERRAAIDSFKDLLDSFVEEINNRGFASVSYDEKDIKVSTGE